MLCILYDCDFLTYILHSSHLHSFHANTMSDIERKEIDSDEEIHLLLERLRRYVKLTTSHPKKLTTSPPKKKKTSALKTLKHDKKKVISIEDMGLNDKLSQEVFSREGTYCYECGGFRHISPECGNLKDRRKGKALATLWDKYEDDENPSSDEELAIIYTEFGAKSVKVEDDGKVAFTYDPQEELDIKVVGVATHRDLAHSSSRDKFDDLDEGDDSIGEMEIIGCKDSHILIGLFRRQITIGVSL